VTPFFIWTWCAYTDSWNNDKLGVIHVTAFALNSDQVN